MGQQSPVAQVVVIASDTSGAPLYDAEVRARPEGASARELVRVTDEDGSVALALIPGQRYRIELRAGLDLVGGTVVVRTGQVDTLRYELAGPFPGVFSRWGPFSELRFDERQPRLEFSTAVGGVRAIRVDSVLVSQDRIVFTGYHHSGTTDAEFEPVLRRTGAGLVLDLERRREVNLGFGEVRTRWRAVVSELLPTRYHVTIRDAEDPSTGPAVATILWSGFVDLRRPEAFAVPVGETGRGGR